MLSGIRQTAVCAALYGEKPTRLGICSKRGETNQNSMYSASSPGYHNYASCRPPMHLSIIIIVSIISTTLPLGADPFLRRKPSSHPLPQPFWILVPVTSKVTVGQLVLAKVLANHCMSTNTDVLAIVGQILETLQPSCTILPFLQVTPDHIADTVAVLPAVVQETITRVSIPTSTTSLLIIPFKALGHAPMHHKTHILLVNAHTERRRRHDYVIACLILDPARQRLLLDIDVQFCVKGPGTNPFIAQRGRNHFALVARVGIDDPGDVLDAFTPRGKLGLSLVRLAPRIHALQPGDKVVKPIIRLVARKTHLDMQIRPMGRLRKCLEPLGGLCESQGPQHVLAHLLVGCGGEAHDGHIGEGLAEPAQPLKVLAEIVAPFADAVGLVDGDAGELALLVDDAELAAEMVERAELWGDVEQTAAWVAGGEVGVDGLFEIRACVGVEGAGVDVGSAQGLDLVHHEGEQGGDDDGDAMVDDGGKLEAEGFAKGGGGLDEDVGAGKSSFDDLFLHRSVRC